MTGLYRIPPHLERFCDDASTFPPGNAGLADALEAHVAHSRSTYRKFLGPFIVDAPDVEEFATLAAGLPHRSVWTAVTVPSPADATPALSRVLATESLWLAGAEIALPDGLDPDRVVPQIAAALDAAGVGETEIYVEVPRDERRDAVLDALADSHFDAKFRTGGATAEAFPDEGEVAEAILGAVRRHLPFKATAGLSRAVRYTDPATGFEHHGFLNLFLAADAAREGVDRDPRGLRDGLVHILGEREVFDVALAMRALDPRRGMAVRASFTSFGGCSVMDPLAEFMDLGLIGPPEDA